MVGFRNCRPLTGLVQLGIIGKIRYAIPTFVQKIIEVEIFGKSLDISLESQ